MIKLYLDEKMEQQLNSIDFGDVEAGESKKLTLYLYNDSEHEVTDLKYSCDDKFIHFTESPEKVLPKETVSFIVEWSPALNLRKALESEITVKGIETIRPKKEKKKRIL